MTIKKLLTLTLFAFICLNTKAQLFTQLDKGIDKPIHSSCFDSKGNVTVLYSSDNATIKIDIWNPRSKKWTNYTEFHGFPSNKYSSIYKNDSLYVFVGGGSLSDIFYINNSSKYSVGRFFYSNSNISSDVNLNIYKNFIVATGNFDSIHNPTTGQGLFSSRVALFNGNNWVRSNFTNNTIASDNQNNINPITVVNKDTLYVSVGYGLYKYVYPNTWSKISSTQNIYGLTLLGNELLYSGLWGDTLFSNKNNSRKLTNSYIYNRNINCLITHKNIVYMKTGNGWLNKLNGSTLSKIYQFDSTDFQKFHIMTSNDTHFYIGNKTPFSYKNKYYSNFTELNVDSIQTFGFDTIRGFIFWDKNKNNIKDLGDENISGYIGIKNLTYGNAGGLFGFDGKFSQIVPNYSNVEYSLNYFQVDTCLKQPFTGSVKSNNTANGITADSIYFPLVRTSLNTYNNLALKSFARSRQRLDDSSSFNYNINNEGCNFQSENINVTITLDKDYVITRSIPTYTSKSGNILTYQFNILSNNSQNIQVNGFYPNNKYSLGQKIKHWAKVTSTMSDDTTDNTDTIHQLLSYSYDPNSKHSEPEGRITSNLKKIRYTINFQNEGNDDARRVTIVDTLNLKMPVYEFQMAGATHTYSVSIQPGTSVVTWTFDNINLKPKEQNEALSKGYLVFDAKVRGDLHVGDSIRNKAYIYFDYNTPIITNYAVIHKRDESSNIESKLVSNNLILYPNPSSNFITIKSKIDNQDITIYDMKGASIKTIKISNNNKSIIDVSQWAKGIYLLVSEGGESLKFVVE